MVQMPVSNPKAVAKVVLAVAMLRAITGLALAFAAMAFHALSFVVLR